MIRAYHFSSSRHTFDLFLSLLRLGCCCPSSFVSEENDPEETNKICYQHSQHWRHKIEVYKDWQGQELPICQQHIHIKIFQICESLFGSSSFKNGQEIEREGSEARCECEPLQQKLGKSLIFKIGDDRVYEVEKVMRK